MAGRHRSGNRAARILTVIALGVLGMLATGTAGHADADPSQGKLLLVLDSSGSMKEPDASGSTKIVAAKKALGAVVDHLPDQAKVGLRVYGATVFAKTDPGACSDTQLVVPIGPADKPALKSAIARYKPYGETPIAYSLRQAAKDVGTTGQRTILLVSDGEETCHTDPCLVAREIAVKGIDLKIDVVGFRVAGRARDQLRCVADAGRGSYYDADSADDLLASLDRLSTRAFRPFELAGTPVEGRPDAAGAPAIGVGQYVTHLGGQKNKRYYRVRKTPGSTLWVTVTSRPSRDDRSDEIVVYAETPDGEACGDAYGDTSDIGNLNHRHEVLSGSMVIDASIEDERQCARSDTLLVHLERRRGGSDIVAVQLLVIEEPPVANASSLPPPAQGFEADKLTWTAAGAPKPVTGGAGFPDAPTLRPGLYSDGILPGEALVYRVRLDFGQHLESRVKVPKPAPALSRALPSQLEMDDLHFGPTRQQLTPGFGTAGLITGHGNAYAQAVTFGSATPEVRYRNRQADQYDTTGASLAGFYYVMVTAAADDNGQSYVIPFQLDVRVVGTPHGQPAYEKLPAATTTKAPTTPPATQPTARHGERGTAEPAGAVDHSIVPVALASGAGAAILLGLGVLLLRRLRA